MATLAGALVPSFSPGAFTTDGAVATRPGRFIESLVISYTLDLAATTFTLVADYLRSWACDFVELGPPA